MKRISLVLALTILLGVNSFSAYSRDKLMNTTNVYYGISFKQQEKFYAEAKDYAEKSEYKDSAFLYKVGRMYMKNNSYERAYEFFSKDLGNDPRNVFGAGIAAKLIGKFPEAIDYLSRAISMNPNLYNAYYLRGEVHQFTGNFDSAIADYKKYLRFRRNEKPYIKIASIYLRQKQTNSAKSILEEGAKKLPNSSLIRKELARVYNIYGK